jgi:histidyl-tRNA synthetase
LLDAVRCTAYSAASMTKSIPLKVQSVRGTHDVFGDMAARFARVTGAFESVAARFAFQPVSPPVFEFTQVFARAIGEATDVVAKEMYSFEDRGGESLTLRPEFTAGIARAYVSNGWQQFAPLKLFAHGPAFRYERPQKGRYRQFHQIDAEIIGAAEPQADSELIGMAQLLLNELGISDAITLNLNTLGDAPSRAAWRGALVDYFSSYKDVLSQDSLARLEKNPLRILDSKDAADIGVVAGAPLLDKFLSREAGAFFETVQKNLSSMGVKYTHAPRLVRGLDYYSHTAFEFITDALGAQGTVLGGGRYDGLIEQFGGAPTPAVGWAAGIERLAMLLGDSEPEKGAIAIVPLGESAHAAAMALAQQLRAAGYAIDHGLRGNMKKRMARAAANNAPAALILGDDEIAAGVVGVKDFATGTQENIAISALPDYLKVYR